MNFKNGKDFKSQLSLDERFRKQILENPEKLEEVEFHPMVDKHIFIVIIGTVGAIVLICLISAIIFTFCSPGQQIPTFIATLGSTSLGAIVGLLSPYNSKS